MRDVAVELDRVRGQVMVVDAPIGGVHRVGPRDELGRAAEERAVVVERVGMVGGRDELVVVAVEAAREALNDLANRLAVKQRAAVRVGSSPLRPPLRRAGGRVGAGDPAEGHAADDRRADRILVVVEPGHLAGGVETGDRRPVRAHDARQRVGADPAEGEADRAGQRVGDERWRLDRERPVRLGRIEPDGVPCRRSGRDRTRSRRSRRCSRRPSPRARPRRGRASPPARRSSPALTGSWSVKTTSLNPLTDRLVWSQIRNAVWSWLRQIS